MPKLTMTSFKFRAGPIGRKMSAALCSATVMAAVLAGCGARIDRHGHMLTDTDLQQVQPGMSKDQVKLSLGTPDTTSTVGGDAYYYISSTHSIRPMGKPTVIDRKIVAIYFDKNESVARLADYGLKDGRVFDFQSKETPSRGKEVTLLEQLFGNLGTRRDYAKELAKGGAPPTN